MFAKTVTFLLWRLFSESVCQNLKTRTRHVLCGQTGWGEIGGVCFHRRGFGAHGFGKTLAAQAQMSSKHLAIEKVLLMVRVTVHASMDIVFVRGATRRLVWHSLNLLP